jgi:hypothetical protein
MREMLLNGIPGEPFQYGCYLSFQPKLNDVMRELIYPIQRLDRKVDGFGVYRGILGGLLWAFVVSSHNERFPHPEAFLSKEGVLPIYNSGQAGFEYFQSVAEQVKQMINKK